MNLENRFDEESIRSYEKNGYLQYHKPVLTDDQFSRLTAIFEENLAKYGEDGLDTPHFRDERLLEFLLCDEVLSLVTPLIGPNVGLWSSHFICKPPFKGKATPWHEDSSYWNGRMDRMSNICTVWLAIDPAFPENGSMGVIPGTHVNGFSEYENVDTSKNIFGAQVKDVDESSAVYMSLNPNECSLHDSRIIHGAKPNTSPNRRCGYTMRYFPTDNKVTQDDPRNRDFKIWLVRGVDVAGNRYVNA
jgi:ectoine hydroxylase-related dioxygenase (phytanoyl-CoA dioxygenase family)